RLGEGEVWAEQLDICDEMVGRVVAHLAQRRRAPGTALIEDDDAPIRRVEEPSVHGRCAGAGTAMQEQQRRAARIARLLPIHRVPRVELEAAGAVRLDRRGKAPAARLPAPASG